MSDVARTRWGTVRRIWARLGVAAGVLFLVWSFLAYRPTAEALRALESDGHVSVTRGDGYWRFNGPADARAVGFLFFPGSLVDPMAYAPLTRAVAARGYTTLLVEMPRRGAFGGALGSAVRLRYIRAIRESEEHGGPRRWVVGGHSRGAAVAAGAVRGIPAGVAGLVLIGASQPRELALPQSAALPVTRIYGTHDSIANVSKIEASRSGFPASTWMLRLEGGNHSQFGYYGFQPGDWRATISREEQHRLTVEGIVETLRRASVYQRPLAEPGGGLPGEQR